MKIKNSFKKIINKYFISKQQSKIMAEGISEINNEIDSNNRAKMALNFIIDNMEVNAEPEFTSDFEIYKWDINATQKKDKLVQLIKILSGKNLNYDDFVKLILNRKEQQHGIHKTKQ